MDYIYLDHAATAPMDKQVTDAMVPVMNEVFGNPSSVHGFGRKARQQLDEARRVMARSIHANEKEIIFTSGGTEANNMALIGTALANKDKGRHIITTVQEHHATLHTAMHLESAGFHVTYLPVDETGIISVTDLQNALTDETILVSIMYVNNETGMIQPVEEIGNILSDHQAYFHTDAVQAYGLFDINVKEAGIDMLSVSSHKISGPKGIGFLYTADDVKLEAIQYGGEQERKRRPGTENVAGAAGFQKAVQLTIESKQNRNERYARYKKMFLNELDKAGVRYDINGVFENGAASILNISFPGTNVESMLTNLDLSGVSASSGSACTAGSVEPSHVLTAMYGEGNERTTNSVRFSFGIHNTDENVREAGKRVAGIAKRLAA
ncbi:cysteine desulfurase family protein [Virgibacillus siamensis]|uniref:cysteine desulfurase family protein n=1 Tax=Virgibacillus siamensis TaxID=480071 RepID=UPI000987BB2E|nr:cysteine desulfurase family protein [Virgibacillus siamensis]